MPATGFGAAPPRTESTRQPSESVFGAPARTVLTADPARVAQPVEELEHLRISDLAAVRLMPRRNSGDLHMADLGDVALERSRQVAGCDLQVIQVALQSQVRFADPRDDLKGIDLAGQQVTGHVAGVYRLDQQLDPVRREPPRRMSKIVRVGLEIGARSSQASHRMKARHLQRACIGEGALDRVRELAFAARDRRNPSLTRLEIARRQIEQHTLDIRGLEPSGHGLGGVGVGEEELDGGKARCLGAREALRELDLVEHHGQVGGKAGHAVIVAVECTNCNLPAMTLAFHASPPAGQWINDPNGLAYVGGAYRLFAQHRVDAPAFRETGWARFSSPDLLRWTFDRCVIEPVGSEWAYSGSVEHDGRNFTALYTAHDKGLERQVRATSTDGGLHWSAATDVAELGSPAANRRDPYLFRDGAEWAVLLSEPCDWTNWPSQPPSRLRLYRSQDSIRWQEAGTIGPWRPAGIMWEVPLFARLDGHDVLFVSEIDRRAGGAACSVRAWIGTLEETGFVRGPGVPAEGELVDRGPDFYAMMASVEHGWLNEDRAFVAWLSNWQTARDVDWPGFRGGPISLPRTLGIEASPIGLRLTSRPLPAIEKNFTRRVARVPQAGRGTLNVMADRLSLRFTGDMGWACIDIDWTVGSLVIERFGELPWRGESLFVSAEVNCRRIQIFLDGPAIEFFMLDEGLSASLALGSHGEPFAVAAQSNVGSPVLLWDELA